LQKGWSTKKVSPVLLQKGWSTKKVSPVLLQKGWSTTPSAIRQEISS
jgi:hypothetical protein